MPVIKSAKKKLRRDRKVEKANLLFKKNLLKALKDAKKSKTAEKVSKAVRLTDKAAKKRIINKNRAARIKSGLSKLVKHPVKQKTVKASTVKKPAKKTKK